MIGHDRIENCENDAQILCDGIALGRKEYADDPRNGGQKRPDAFFFAEAENSDGGNEADGQEQNLEKVPFPEKFFYFGRKGVGHKFLSFAETESKACAPCGQAGEQNVL